MAKLPGISQPLLVAENGRVLVVHGGQKYDITDAHVAQVEMRQEAIDVTSFGSPHRQTVPGRIEMTLLLMLDQIEVVGGEKSPEPERVESPPETPEERRRLRLPPDAQRPPRKLRRP